MTAGAAPSRFDVAASGHESANASKSARRVARSSCILEKSQKAMKELKRAEVPEPKEWWTKQDWWKKNADGEDKGGEPAGKGRDDGGDASKWDGLTGDR